MDGSVSVAASLREVVVATSLLLPERVAGNVVQTVVHIKNQSINIAATRI